MFSVLFLFFLCFAPFHAAHACTLFVSEFGSDVVNCGSSLPQACLTIHNSNNDTQCSFAVFGHVQVLNWTARISIFGISENASVSISNNDTLLQSCSLTDVTVFSENAVFRVDGAGGPDDVFVLNNSTVFFRGLFLDNVANVTITGSRLFGNTSQNAGFQMTNVTGSVRNTLFQGFHESICLFYVTIAFV